MKQSVSAGDISVGRLGDWLGRLSVTGRTCVSKALTSKMWKYEPSGDHVTIFGYSSMMRHNRLRNLARSKQRHTHTHTHTHTHNVGAATTESIWPLQQHAISRCFRYRVVRGRCSVVLGSGSGSSEKNIISLACMRTRFDGARTVMSTLCWVRGMYIIDPVAVGFGKGSNKAISVLQENEHFEANTSLSN